MLTGPSKFQGYLCWSGKIGSFIKTPNFFQTDHFPEEMHVELLSKNAKNGSTLFMFFYKNQVLSREQFSLKQPKVQTGGSLKAFCALTNDF